MTLPYSKSNFCSLNLLLHAVHGINLRAIILNVGGQGFRKCIHISRYGLWRLLTFGLVPAYVQDLTKTLMMVTVFFFLGFRGGASRVPNRST